MTENPAIPASCGTHPRTARRDRAPRSTAAMPRRTPAAMRSDAELAAAAENRAAVAALGTTAPDDTTADAAGAPAAAASSDPCRNLPEYAARKFAELMERTKRAGALRRRGAAAANTTATTTTDAVDAATAAADAMKAAAKTTTGSLYCLLCGRCSC